MTLKAEVDRFNSIVKCPEDREMMVNLTLMSNESPSPAFVNIVRTNDILQCVNPEGQHRYKVIGVREQEVEGFEEVFVEKLAVTPEIQGSQKQNEGGSSMTTPERIQEEQQRLVGLLEDAKSKIVEVKDSDIFSYTREHVSGKLDGAVVILNGVIIELRGW